MASRAEKRKALIEKTKAALRSDEFGADEAIGLCKELKELDEFGYAWRLLKRFRESDDIKSDDARDLEFRQVIALCTYKDTHINDEHRLVRALEILDEGGDLKDSDSPETLGLAGAIHKRLWQVRRDKQELERSLQYYRRGHGADHATGYKQKQGYPGINAAFVLDLLASLDKETNGLSVSVSSLLLRLG